ncbi:MAG: (Fe-S)-binding protein [Chloroflexota bacterium]
MLTLAEKIIFVLAVLVSLYAVYHVAERIKRIVLRGKGKPDLKLALKRLPVLLNIAALAPTWKIRFWPSLFHAFIAWGFIYYLLVNLGDVLEGYIPNFVFLGQGAIGDVYRFLGDLLSVGVLTGMLAMVIRRFVLKDPRLTARDDVLLQPAARAGIRRDSAIVAGFIFVHVGSRFLGQSFQIAAHGAGFDGSRPFASLVAGLWGGLSPAAITVAEHVTFWLALGTILGFMPYFLYSKHIHLFMAPLNFLLKPERRSIGELSKIDFDDESLEEFGASKLEDLGWEQLVDAYACIMCYRCQQVCPAYNTGKVLSPAAMEINKRYLINREGARLANGEASSAPLVEFAIPPEAVWACTSCGACIDICPVGNEPMRDILDIRRALVLMENQFPKQLQAAFKGMERQVNPWGVPPTDRMKWAEGIKVPTIEENPEPELLWWVGCAPATDARAQKTARAFAEILNSAGVNYAVLGQNEQCTGDSARRAGKEDIFFGLAQANVEILNEVAPKRIVTTCPHCLHTLKNEYPAFGGNYTVIHHTQLLNELTAAGKIKITPDGLGKLTFHDPCYLGRHNQVLDAPRQVLKAAAGGDYLELERWGMGSFCCGAGGAQMWKEEEHSPQRVNHARFDEVAQSGADTLAVGCPFCMVMMNDAKKDRGSEIEVLDVAEIVAQNMVK